jgi:hypothetical protein
LLVPNAREVGLSQHCSQDGRKSVACENQMAKVSPVFNRSIIVYCNRPLALVRSNITKYTIASNTTKRMILYKYYKFLNIFMTFMWKLVQCYSKDDHDYSFTYHINCIYKTYHNTITFVYKIYSKILNISHFLFIDIHGESLGLVCTLAL